ncbi:MAG TPA: hypothetical protein VF546_15655 [Pyrinomonadaceae bacterium]|jgi:hypothetical protein
MAIKIENQATTKLPRQTETWLGQILDSVPREHLRGVERVRLVDSIKDPRVPLSQRGQLPGLYHPRQGTQPAWLEISIEALLPGQKPFYKRLLPRLSFKNNLAAVLLSLVAQHYHLTLRHSVKKGQLEQAVRSYTERQLRLWGERQHTWRARLFKPLQPTFERWARTLQRRAKEERKKSARTS